MNPQIRTNMIHKAGKFLGWKVYLNGKKYPPKPRDYYENMLEERAISLAHKTAGLGEWRS